MYELASSSYEKSKKETKNDVLYRDILERQTKYSINLANNQAFREWVVSDAEKSWKAFDPEFSLPPFKESFVKFYGSEEYVAEDILTTDRLNSAIYELYYYRADAGLEMEPPLFRRRRLDIPYSDQSFWAMCSDPTK